MKHEKKVKSDRALRFYNEVLGLDHLHYGMWKPDDEVSIDNLKHAQKRYEDYLVENIPEGINNILDVGCGTGELSKRLKSLGYNVEGVSPDINQKTIYPEKVNAPFHHYCFEEFTPEKEYDMIIMSESCQYIPLDRLFTSVNTALKKDGFWMVCDYFVLNNASGTLAKSGHNLEKFTEGLSGSGFKTIKDEDITGQVVKTLDLSKQIVDKVLLALDIGTEKFREKKPVITKIARWVFRKKIKKFETSMILLDSEKFSEAKRYKFYLFQKTQ